jgi:hypothetical protein
MEALLPFLVVLSVFSTVAWVIRGFVASRQRIQVARLQAEMQTRLLEKFGTSQELLAYLESAPGERFVESVTIERAKPYGRILGSMQSGVILALVGLALLYLSGRISEADDGFLFLGTVSFALGLGFLVSAFLAYRLSRSWGLIDGRAGEAG